MKRFLNPTLLFFALTVLLFVRVLIGFFINKEVDITIHDTYFILDRGKEYWPATGFYFLITMIYFLFDLLKKPLNKAFGQVHFWGILVSFGLILISFRFLNTGYKNEESLEEMSRNTKIFTTFIVSGFVLLLASNLLFLINILITSFKRKRYDQLQ